MMGSNIGPDQTFWTGPKAYSCGDSSVLKSHYGNDPSNVELGSKVCRDGDRCSLSPPSPSPSPPSQHLPEFCAV